MREIFLEFQETVILFVHDRVTTTSRVSSKAKMTNFECALSYALQKIGAPGMKSKPEQILAIKSVYDGRDVFVWLPTGFGKSLCYEALPFVSDWKRRRVDSKPTSVVLVVSPLLALMVDEVRSLRKRAVRSAIITAGSGGVERELYLLQKKTSSNVACCTVL